MFQLHSINSLSFILELCSHCPSLGLRLQRQPGLCSAFKDSWSQRTSRTSPEVLWDFLYVASSWWSLSCPKQMEQESEQPWPLLHVSMLSHTVTNSRGWSGGWEGEASNTVETVENVNGMVEARLEGKRTRPVEPQNWACSGWGGDRRVDWISK